MTESTTPDSNNEENGQPGLTPETGAASDSAATDRIEPATDAAAQSTPHTTQQTTDAFGRPVAPAAGVYAPDTQPQSYAQQGAHPGYPHPGWQGTQPTQPYPAAAATATDTKTKNRGVMPIVAALIAGALIGGGSAAGVSALMANENGSHSQSTAAPQNVVVNDTTSVNQITAVAAKATPSVVTVSVTGSAGAGTGSGVVLSSDGYVLTNTHVVTLDGSASDVSIQVQMSDGTLHSAKIVGTDPTVDLAVIKIDGASGLTPLKFTDSSKLNVGDVAIAIGAPLGLSNTVTNGIVSALNRSIQVASSAAPKTEQAPQQTPGQGNGQGSPFDFWNFDMPGQQQQQQQQATSTISLPVVQTDAAINPGNSGGALLNSKGELIGINVAIASAGQSSSGSQAGSIGVGFAIPANLAKRVADELIQNGSATHGLLGATVGDAASSTATVVGAQIKEVSSGGAADQAGLKAGDVITEFNGVPISDASDLTAQVRFLPAGAKADLSYVRDGKTQTASVTLGELKG